jgi:hypothetical protein
MAEQSESKELEISQNLVASKELMLASALYQILTTFLFAFSLSQLCAPNQAVRACHVTLVPYGRSATRGRL